MRRIAWVLFGASFGTLATAQIPDVLVKVDGLLHYRSEAKGKTTLRAYDSLGNYGTVGLSFTLEPGFQVLIAQRFQAIDDSADEDQLDLMFVEDRGFWRVGKQIMPFGANGIVRENSYGARFETNLGSDALPASLAAVDGGTGRQRGVMGRVGTRLGFSFAIGNRFGLDPASFATFRRPEDSPGKGYGYREMYGVDYARKLGQLNVRVEHVVLRRPERDTDEDNSFTDIYLWLEPELRKTLGIGLGRDWEDNSTHIRVLAKIPAALGMWFEPMLLMKNGEVRSFGVSLRVRF